MSYRRKLPLRQNLLQLVAGFQCHVSHTEADTDLLEEIIRRGTPREDPHEIIGDFSCFAFNIEINRAGSELQRIGVEQDGQLAGADALFDSLFISVLDAAEPGLAV